MYVCFFRFVKEKNPYDIWGVTPLHLAAENGHLEIVKFLMEYLHDEKNPKSYIEFSGLGKENLVKWPNCLETHDATSSLVTFLIIFGQFTHTALGSPFYDTVKIRMSLIEK